MNKIYGSGGGGKGGGGGGISEDPDTLSTVATARFLDLICEGPIEGFMHSPNADYSIYLDGVPLRDFTGAINYRPYTFQVTSGLPHGAQSPLEGFANVLQENVVNLKVTTALNIVARSIPDAGADAVRVTLAVNGLSSTDSKGKISGTTIQYEIHTRVAGGTWRLSLANTLTEKTRSRAQVQHEVLLGDLGPGPYEVGVKRITADSASSLLVNDLFWDAYTIVNYEKLSYPHSVLAGVTLDARYFSNVPQRAYHIRGLKVPVPANCVDANGNYDASYRTTGSGTTAGAWNGTFVSAWTNNPVWCLYDLLTSRKHGLGRRIFGEGISDLVNGGTFLTSVDKFTLYTIAKYCDEWVYIGSDSSRIGYTKTYNTDNAGQLMASVPTETKNYERRFTFNAYINTLEDAYKLINNVCSVFRGMAYWSAGMVTLAQDAPGTPTKIFTNANVVDGLFAYEGSSRAERHTAVTVAWNDPSEDFKRKYEYIEDRDSIIRYGYRPDEVIAFGCTSRTQAIRLGRYKLLTERLDNEMIMFKTGLEAAMGLYPGRLIQIADSDRAGTRWGGRIKSTTVNRFLWSNDISNAYWTKSGATAAAAPTVVAPDGANLSIALTESAALGTHLLSRVLTSATWPNWDQREKYTFSFYAKANGRTLIQAYVMQQSGVHQCAGTFNLSTGIASRVVFTGESYDGEVTQEALANGWYRCRVSGVPMGPDGTGQQVQIRLTDGTSASYTGDGTSGVYIWGLQFERGGVLNTRLATTTTNKGRVYFDVEPNLPTSGTYTLSAIMPSGELESRPVNILFPGPQEYVVFDFFSDEPADGAVWTLASETVAPVTARIVSIKEDGPASYSVMALQSNQSKYAAIDQGAEVIDQNYTFLSVQPPATPTNLKAIEYAYKPTVQAMVRSDALVSWDKINDPTIRGYMVKATSDNETRRYPETVEPRITLDNLPAGSYVISVEAVNFFGVKSSTPGTVPLTVINLDTTPPGTVTGLAYTIDPVNGVRLTWDTQADFIDYYEVRVGPTWTGSTLVARISGSGYTVGGLVSGSYNYMVAAVDTSGNVSTTKSSITVNLAAPTAPSFNVSIDGTDEVMVWTSSSSLILIDRYEIREGASFAAGIPVTVVKGNDFRRPVNYSGTKTYWIAAIDVTGNVGAATSDTVTPPVPTTPAITLTKVGSRLRIDWTASESILPIVRYEVRYGASFAAGTPLFSGDVRTLDIPIDWLGSRTFWVTATNGAGTSSLSDSAEFVVVAPGAVTGTRAEVVDNNALLYWSAPTTGNLPIDRYEVRRGASWAAGSIVGSNGASTFTTIFEQTGGTVKYWIAAYDTAGNIGTPIAITALISQPPDYVLYNDFTSTFSGTKVNMALVDGALYGSVDAAQTVEMHFGGGLLSSPDDLSGGTVTVINGTVTSNVENDAGGFLTVDRVNRTTAADHYVLRTYTTTAHANKTYTFSAWLRLGTLTGTIVMQIQDGSGAVVGTATHTVTSTLARFSVTGTFGATPAANIRLVINPTNNVGVVGDTFFVANSQLVEGSSATTYFRSPQGQISDSLPLYLQPSAESGSYQEVIDYGADLPGTQVTASLASTVMAGSPSVTVQIEYKKAADVSWTAFPANVSSYLAAGGLRYLRLTYSVSTPARADLIRFDSLTVKLNLKLKTDSQRGSTVLGGAHTQGNLISGYKSWALGSYAQNASFGGGYTNTYANLTGESVIADEAGPGGVVNRLLKCVQVTPAVSTYDGGFLSSAASIDPTQVYLFACFVQKNTTNGQFFMGARDSVPGSERAETLAGVASTNPYFISGLSSAPTTGAWFLYVGLIHEIGYSGGQTSISGVYDMNGSRQASPAPTDYRWRTGTTAEFLRASISVDSVDAAGVVTARMCRPAIIKTTRAAAPALIQKMIKDAVSYGKEVTFGQSFIDIQGLAPSIIGSVPYTPIVDFIDTPFPTTCNVYAFDTSGNRVAADFSLTTRGA